MQVSAGHRRGREKKTQRSGDGLEVEVVVVVVVVDEWDHFGAGPEPAICAQRG